MRLVDAVAWAEVAHDVAALDAAKRSASSDVVRIVAARAVRPIGHEVTA
jgi:hypothetical protein